jgi:SNF2 family DNA or RNA helicase
LNGLSLPADIRPYQAEGISFLLHSDAALLADEMGLGKTVQTITALRLLLRMEGFDRALIIAPASLRLNWHRELDRWAPELSVRLLDGVQGDRLPLYNLPVSVLIASYEQIRADAVRLTSSTSFDLLVLDEAQRIKDSGSASSLACRILRRKCAWALSGTPLENRVEDLLSLFKFLAPALIPAAASKDEIHQAIKPHFLRRRKSEVLKDLPPIIYQDLDLELQGSQLKSYLDLWNSRESVARGDGIPVSPVNLLALITRLKLICNFDPNTGNSVKLDALQLMVESLEEADDKIIIFSQYVATLKTIAKAFPNVPHDLYHGAMSETERDDALSHFERSPGPRLLLISLKAGGVGLNLQSASVVVLFDRWWNPAVEEQAVQRAHRFGRTRPLHVVRFLVRDSIEDRIQEILSDKRELFDQYVNGASELDDGILTRDDLCRLLQLRAYRLKTSSVMRQSAPRT